MSIVKFCHMDAAADFSTVAGILEVGTDWIQCPSPDAPDKAIARAVQAIQHGGFVTQADLGRLLSYISNVLDNPSNYIE